MNLESGTIINQYKIISPIGKGGMGEVFLAEDTKLDRKIALKILPPEFAADKDRMSRFVREAKAASALNHPNIITIHEIGDAGGTHFIATEFIEGKTLNEYVKSNPLNFKSSLEIAIQIASALDEAHSAGIVHRDIKPDNVMIRANGLAKILDFGIAKLPEPPKSVGEEDATAIKPQSTSPGMIIGTANYMSPEQAKGKEIDARTDIFSFGIVFYEMLTGKLPFTGETALESISSILKDEPRPISQILPDVPGEIERIAGKALRKDRDERYQTAKDLLIDLKDAKQSLELQNLLERTVSPEKAEPKTQILPATTAVEAKQPTTNQTVRHNPARKYLAIGLMILLLSAIGFFAYRYFTSTSKQIESIAVLPFANASGDREAEFLSDGIAETLINNFTKIPNLKVTARSTAFRFRGREDEPQAVGRELGVRAVLTGRVLQRGDSLSVQVDLIDAFDGAQIWGNRYEGKSADIVNIQRRIAADVSSQLKLKLTGAQAEQIAKTYTQNPQAFQHYLRGRYHWNKRTADDLKKGLQEFRAAADIDPNYALAYVGLADSYVVLEEYAGTPSSETLPAARAFIQKALQIDDSIGEAYATLGTLDRYEWRWADAEKNFLRAIELNPHYPTARHWFTTHLRDTGQIDRAFAEIKRAQELDPLSPAINANVGIIYIVKGDASAAFAQFNRIIELNPTSWVGHHWLGLAYLKFGLREEARAALEKSVELNRSPVTLSPLGSAYAATGREKEARNILNELREQYAKKQMIAYHIAGVYAALGEREQAFEWLEKSFQDRQSLLPIIRWHPQFDSLRDDTRFKDLLRRMNLPE